MGASIPGTKNIGTYKGTNYRTDPDQTAKITAGNKTARDIMAGGIATSPAATVAATPRAPARYPLPSPRL